MNYSEFILIIVLIIDAFGNIVTALKCHCNVCASTNYTCETDGFCYTSLGFDENGVLQNAFRCMDKEVVFPPGGDPIWCQQTTNIGEKTSCCTTDFCNNLPLEKDPHHLRRERTSTLQIVVCLCAAILAVSSFVFLWWRLKFIKKILIESNLFHNDNCEVANDYVSAGTAATLKHLIDITTSGSGAGLPLLVQRSIARQVQLMDLIGQGRYGEVWRGRWRGEDVAVKIFTSRDECSWFREAELYQTVMLRHDNVLGFIAADNKDNGSWTQLWLVTDYHCNGSLFDYLSNNTLDMATLAKMSISIANGLAHLHMDILGNNGVTSNIKAGKPAIAHRDLKSKNILVKSNLSCAIGDLGLAVRQDLLLESVDIPCTDRVGTRRYMAPEVIDGTIEENNFDAYRRADIYSLGLVLWELMRRTGKDSMEHQMPYYDVVPSDPSLEDMKHVVCDEKMRPCIYDSWLNDSVSSMVSKLLPECWYEAPKARLTALRIKKNLMKIFSCDVTIVIE